MKKTSLPARVRIAEEISMVWPRIGRKVLAELLQASEITHTQLTVVMILFNNGETRINVISRELRVAPPTATGIVNRLQASGYVIRRADPKDGRSVVIDLTAEGRALALKLKAVVVRRWTGLLSKISRQDAEKYLEILKKISEAL